MKYLFPLLVLLMGCSSASKDEPSVFKAISERLKATQDEAGDAPTGKQTPTRAQITEFNVAMIQFNLEGEDIYPIMLPTHVNRGYVIYGNKFRQSITLRESQITGTRGLGTDLVSATSSENDPLKRLTPPQQWPQRMTREYRFGGGGPSGRIESYTCTFSLGEASSITLAGTSFAVIRIEEDCGSAENAFQNVYFADVKTGRVWQSRQYIGAAMPMLNLDILEPLTQ